MVQAILAGCPDINRRVHMVAWWWIIVALFIGAFIGVLTISLCVAAGRADESSYSNIDYPERPR